MGNILESIYNYNKLNENKKLNKKLNESFFDEDGDLTREAIEQIIQLLEKNGFEVTTDIDVAINYVEAIDTFSEFYTIRLDFTEDMCECEFSPNGSYTMEDYDYLLDNIQKDDFTINDISDVNNVLKYIFQIEKETKLLENSIRSELQSLKNKTGLPEGVFSYCVIQSLDEEGILN